MVDSKGKRVVVATVVCELVATVATVVCELAVDGCLGATTIVLTVVLSVLPQEFGSAGKEIGVG